MLEYNIIYVITNFIFIFAIYKLFHAFFNEDAYNNKIERISYTIYFVLCSILVFITRIPIINLIFTIFMLFLISLNYKSSIQNKIIFTSFIYSILFIIEILISIYIGFLDISALSDSSFNSCTGIILIRTTTMIVAYLINRYKLSINKNFDIPPLYYLMFTIILFGTLYLFAVSLESDNISIHSVLVRGIVLISVNVIMILLDEKIYKLIITTNEKNILAQQNIAYENQAKIISQSTETIKSLKHDIKNHLIVLNHMCKLGKKDEIESYVGNIIEQMDSGMFSQSNNFAIDSIINFKLCNIKNKNIQINVDVNVPIDLNITPYDITVILGNLIDNAITAIEQSEKKILNLNISCNMGNLIILLENSYNGKLLIKNNKFKTTKIDFNNHGIGFSNIENSLNNYGGEMEINYTKDIFSVAIIIPY